MYHDRFALSAVSDGCNKGLDSGVNRIERLLTPRSESLLIKRLYIVLNLHGRTGGVSDGA
jgi:hypothetical protein